MKNCSVCGSANLNEFCVAEKATDIPGLGDLANYTFAWWCEDCGSMHTEMGVSQPEHSMLNRQVLAFHHRFGQSIGEHPHVPDEKTMRFRLSLIAEEFFELLEAATGGSATYAVRDVKARTMDAIKFGTIKVDLPEFVDAMGDLDYVVDGTRITMGVDGTPIAAEIQRANMAKLPSYVAAKDATHGLRRCTWCGKSEGDTGDCERIDVDGAVLMGPLDAKHNFEPTPVKREDGKILKPPGWTPPDIKGCLRAQGWVETLYEAHISPDNDWNKP